MPGRDRNLPNPDPQPVEAIFAAVKRKLRDVHTSMAGTIVSYNPADRTAVIQLATQIETGPEQWTTTAPLAGVPVIWPGSNASGGFFAQLLPGDNVLVIFCEQDPSTWWRSGVVGLPPALTKRHGLYAFAIPGNVTSLSAKVPPTNGVWLTPTGVDLGAAAGTSPVVLGAALQLALYAAATAAATAAVPTDGGTAAFTAFANAINLPAWLAAIAATKVRAI